MRKTHDYAVLDLSPRAWCVADAYARLWDCTANEALERIIEAWAKQEGMG